MFKIRRFNLGAGMNAISPGWLHTDSSLLDVTSIADWNKLLRGRKLYCLKAEHVWEHLTAEQARIANELCYDALAPGGRFRMAVPDGLHPDPDYIDHVRVGGSGPGADDHKILYTYETLKSSLEAAGFRVELLEYWDETGTFHRQPWDPRYGMIKRSAEDERNRKDGTLRYTSIIVDAIKPAA